MAEKSVASINSITDSLRDILTGAAISFLGFAMMRLAGLVEKVLIARFLDPSRYGQVTLAVSLLSVASIVGSLGIRTGVVRYLPRYESETERNGIVSVSVKMTMVASLILTGLLFLSAEWFSTTIFHDPEMSILLKIISLSIPLAVLGQLGASIAQGVKDARTKNIIENITFPLSRILLIAVAILVGVGTVGVAWAYVGGYGLMALFAAIYIYLNFDVPYVSDFDRTQLLRFSLPLLFANGMSFISSSLDTILIGAYLTSNKVGIYGAAYPLARLVFIGPSLMSVIFTPVMSQLHASNDMGEMRDVYDIVTKWIVILTLPGVAMLVVNPEIFLEHIFGEEYVAGSVSLALLTLGFFYHVMLGINGGTLKMLGHSDFFLMSTVVNAAVNVGMNLWLIPRIGIEGAAVATVVSYAIGNSLISLRLYREYNIHSFRINNLLTYVVYLPIIAVFYLATSSILGGLGLVIVVYLLSLVAFLAVYLVSTIPTEAEREIIHEYYNKL